MPRICPIVRSWISRKSNERGGGLNAPRLRKSGENTTLPTTTTTTGYKPYSKAKRPDPAGFVSAFENFKFDKNPFFLVKPDGTSDLTPVAGDNVQEA